MATNWKAEAARMVRRPPIRSDSQPQNCRLTKAQPSRTDSMAAPCVGGMPRSPQNATRWPCGMAIGTQQQKPARPSNASATLGFRPSTVPPARGPVAASR